MDTLSSPRSRGAVVLESILLLALSLPLILAFVLGLLASN